MAIEGVILAAGLSTRAGTYKMELRFGDKMLIEKSIEGMYDFCSRIIVVAGHKVERIRQIVNPYPKVQVIFNEDYREGMFSSVKEGIRHVTEERFFFLPGDYPLISKEIYSRMLEAQGDIIIPTYQGRRGHPILIKSHLIQEILEQSKFSNLREFIQAHHCTLLEVEDEQIMMDIDTIEDYKRTVSLILKS